MDITEFKPDKQEKEKINVDKIKQTQEFQDVEREYSDIIEKFLSNYGSMSEEELLAEILKIVAEKKKDGTFDAEKIHKMANVISPLLSPEQDAKMKNLLNFLD